MTEQWVKTDEAEDVAGSIRHALRVATFLQEDPQAWKWVMLALHSALQGACVCHLTTTAAPVGALTKQNTVEWLKFLEQRDPEAQAPKTYLMGLPDMLKAVRKPHSAGDCSNDTGILISDVELTWLRDLHGEVRNQFVHFEPMGWSIEVSGVPEFARTVARILSEMLDMGWAFRHLSALGRAAFSRNLTELTEIEWPEVGGD